MKNRENKIICFCFNITYEDIKKYILENNIKTFDSLAEETKITKACSACKNEALALFKSLVN